jgi:Flp pilus assembly protein TadD
MPYSGKIHSSMLTRISIAALAAALTVGCTTVKATPAEMAMLDKAETSPILPAPKAERDAADQKDLLSQATFWGREYDKNPNEYEASLKFARCLRAIGSSERAAEVAGQALALKAGDVELTLIFAQASLDIGKPEPAATALARAEAAGQTDWRMLSIIGVTMDQLDQHVGAQSYYKRALALSPDNPKILSNLGLSYALAGDSAQAESTLRAAVDLPNADARVRQNLVLVLGVQGKFAEAEKAAGPETPKALLDSNTAYFRALLTPARSWDNLRGTQN